MHIDARLTQDDSHNVPTITIARLPELRVNESTRIVLRFANPLYAMMKVTLQSPESEEASIA
jgi:hypothetical protein